MEDDRRTHFRAKVPFFLGKVLPFMSIIYDVDEAIGLRES